MNKLDWGPWSLDKGGCILEHRLYEIDLGTCTSSAEVLDWIMQVATKDWADAETLAGLIHALSDILQPQALLCSGGQDKRITIDTILGLVKQS